jgi:hypothetical protein
MRLPVWRGSTAWVVVAAAGLLANNILLKLPLSQDYPNLLGMENI